MKATDADGQKDRAGAMRGWTGSRFVVRKVMAGGMVALALFLSVEVALAWCSSDSSGLRFLALPAVVMWLGAAYVMLRPRSETVRVPAPRC